MTDLTPAADLVLRLYVTTRSFGIATVHQLRSSERGEGVISAAIAVLVMAFLGVLMWKGFQEIFNTAKDNTKGQVDQIGQG